MTTALKKPQVITLELTKDAAWFIHDALELAREEFLHKGDTGRASHCEYFGNELFTRLKAIGAVI
jgi:hypothetical protein